VALIVSLPRTCSGKVSVHVVALCSVGAPLMFVEYIYIVPTLHNTTTCTDILQLQVLGNGTITATTAPLGVVEYNYIVPTLYNYRLLGVVRSRPRWLPRVCRIQLHCTDTTQCNYMYRHLTAASSWEWYDQGHDGTPRVCRMSVQCSCIQQTRGVPLWP
jgi:hypothetical protein